LDRAKLWTKTLLHVITIYSNQQLRRELLEVISRSTVLAHLLWWDIASTRAFKKRTFMQNGQNVGHLCLQKTSIGKVVGAVGLWGLL